MWGIEIQSSANIHAQDVPDQVRNLMKVVSTENRVRTDLHITCARKGMAIGLTPPDIYCQSRQRDSKPRPSLPLDPPKMRVKSGDLGFARQKIEKPVRSGNIHSGKISQIKMLAPM